MTLMSGRISAGADRSKSRMCPIALDRSASASSPAAAVNSARSDDRTRQVDLRSGWVDCPLSVRCAWTERTAEVERTVGRPTAPVVLGFDRELHAVAEDARATA